MKKFNKKMKVNNKYVEVSITAYGKAKEYYENKMNKKESK